MSNSDRFAYGYEPRFDVDAEVGHEAMLFWNDVTDAMKNGRVEVKHDVMALKTGNAFIERQCFKRGKWRPSSLDVTHAEIWMHVIGRRLAIVLPVDDLKAIVAGRKLTEMPRGSHPTRGAVIPLPQLISEVRYLVKQSFRFPDDGQETPE